MSPEQILYNFENAVEPAVARVFVGAGLIAYTANGKILADGTVDPIDQATPDLSQVLQKDRPRVEIMFTLGAGKLRWHLIKDSDPVENAVETMWGASLAVDLITEADPVRHFDWLSLVRRICPTIQQVNGTTLLYHKIHGPIRYAGESHAYNGKDGYFLTKTNLNFDFSIHADGWALIANNNSNQGAIL